MLRGEHKQRPEWGNEVARKCVHSQRISWTKHFFWRRPVYLHSWECHALVCLTVRFMWWLIYSLIKPISHGVVQLLNFPLTPRRVACNGLQFKRSVETNGAVRPWCHGRESPMQFTKQDLLCGVDLGNLLGWPWCWIAERGSVTLTAATKKLSRQQDTSLLSAFCFFHSSTTGRFMGPNVQKWKTPAIPHSQSASDKLKLQM